LHNKELFTMHDRGSDFLAATVVKDHDGILAFVKQIMGLFGECQLVTEDQNLVTLLLNLDVQVEENVNEQLLLDIQKMFDDKEWQLSLNEWILSRNAQSGAFAKLFGSRKARNEGRKRRKKVKNLQENVEDDEKPLKRRRRKRHQDKSYDSKARMKKIKGKCKQKNCIYIIMRTVNSRYCELCTKISLTTHVLC